MKKDFFEWEGIRVSDCSLDEFFQLQKKYLVPGTVKMSKEDMFVAGIVE